MNKYYYEMWLCKKNNRPKFITIVAISENDMRTTEEIVSEYCVKRNLNYREVEINVLPDN